MDTSNSTDMHFKLVELLDVDDRVLRDKSIRVIKAVVTELKPILKYVTKPWNIRDCHISTCNNLVPFRTAYFIGIAANNDSQLVLLIDRSGEFLIGESCSNESNGNGSHWHIYRNGSDLYTEYFFDDVLSGLRRSLSEARDEQAKRLNTTVTRLAKLDEILVVLKK